MSGGRKGSGPEQEITCSAGHPFATTAAPGTHGVPCKHRMPDGTRCRKKGNVPAAARPRPPAPDPAAPEAARTGPALSGPEPAGPPPGAWADSLGPACPEADTCARYDCDCSRPPVRYTGDHTGTVCPECGPCCWAPPPDAIRRGREHADELERQRARRPVAQVPEISQAERDTAAIALAARKGLMVDELDRLAAGAGPEGRSVLAWFRAEVNSAQTGERLDELAGLDLGSRVRRAIPARVVSYLADDDGLADDDDQADEDQADEDEPGPGSAPARPWRVTAARELPALGSGETISRGPYTPCDRCRRIARHGADGRWWPAAWYTIDPAGVPGLADLGSADLCPPCWSDLRPLPRITARFFPPCPRRSDLLAYAEWQRSKAIADMELARSRDMSRSAR